MALKVILKHQASKNRQSYYKSVKIPFAVLSQVLSFNGQTSQTCMCSLGAAAQCVHACVCILLRKKERKHDLDRTKGGVCLQKMSADWGCDERGRLRNVFKTKNMWFSCKSAHCSRRWCETTIWIHLLLRKMLLGRRACRAGGVLQQWHGALAVWFGTSHSCLKWEINLWLFLILVHKLNYIQISF